MLFRPLLALVPLLLLPACNQGGDAEEEQGGEQRFAFARGTSAGEHPRSLARPDPHHGGRASALHLVSLSYGRLVELHAPGGPSGDTLVARDYVVADGLATSLPDWEVEHGVLGATRVTILHPRGSVAFEEALDALDASLVAIDDKGLSAAELPPFPRVPRDAALVLRFDDLLDPASIRTDALVVAHGTPPDARHSARVFADPHHGASIEHEGGRAFFSTRVIVDLAVSELEARLAPGPLVPTPLGLPAGGDGTRADGVLRLCENGFANLAGHGLSAARNGSRASGADGLEVVRAFTIGGRGDLCHGLLADFDAPRIVGQQAITLSAVSPDPNGGPDDFLVDLVFATAACAQAASPRDVIETAGGSAAVTQASGAPAVGALSGVHVRRTAGVAPSAGPAQFRSPFDPATDQDRAACFVEFVPPPSAPPATGVSPDARIRVRFSEAIDATTADAFAGFELANVVAPSAPHEFLAAAAESNAGQDVWTLVPAVPFDHQQGASERFFVSAGAPLADLAGNGLANALPRVTFSLDPASPGASTGNYVLRFGSTDEDGNGNPELRGQFLHDLTEGVIRARPVTRYSAVADRTQAIPALMTPLPTGVQTPLSPLGSKLQTVWRYCDVGFALQDESNFNVDVEGLAWAPVGGAVVADVFPEFEISLAHSSRLPDEIVDPQSLLPKHPNVGLLTTYATNALDLLQVVHPRQLGYTVDPADLFTASTGTVMLPYPLNQNLPPSQHSYYTWRDTAVQEKAGPGGAGAELEIVVAATGSGTPGVPYPAGQVPTVGLPLLMEFKCFPNDAALGLNAFDVSLAVNSSSRPNFRAFSTGGVNFSGQTIQKDPDLEVVASGGFNPSSNPPGAPTLPTDNVFHVGQLDLVVRVSRVHGVWIDTQGANPSFAAPVLDPAPADLPAGTEVVVAWRGADQVSAALLRDAGRIDAYGEPSSAGDLVAYANGDATWKSTLAAVDGARFVQARITLISNAADGTTPELSGLGIAWTR